MHWFFAFVFAVLSVWFIWLSGAWWATSREASISALIAATIWGLVALLLI